MELNKILDIIKDPLLTYEQTVLSLARAAEDELNVLCISPQIQDLRDEGVICDLFEGHAPYRPRYIVPDYEKFMTNGCKFLNLEAATDIHEAINNLLIFYKHVPSISSFPVYIGSIDKLLEPFVKDDEESFKAIKRFLKHIDRTITDSFCHANIGPEESIAGRLILRAERELEDSIPNLTLKFDSTTSDSFAIDAINTALITAKPSFANNDIFKDEFKSEYAIVSCYNGLPIGGGSYTLVRMNLLKLAEKTDSFDEFKNELLPYAAQKMLEYMDERIRFLVEETPFFKSNFLVREGFIEIEKFTAMFGMIGLAEAVNHFIEDSEKIENRFGHSKLADDLGIEIMDLLEELVSKHNCKYLHATDGKYLLHAQVGIDSDTTASPGCRIPIGDEPEIHQHVLQSSKFHKYFPSGIGDIFNFDAMTKNNPEYVLDIIKGGFKSKLRYFSAYSTDCDVIRISGYLVKKSEIEKLSRGEQVLRDTVALGLGSVNNNRILERKIRK
jgi:YjjI family glycine radical enzyme